MNFCEQSSRQRVFPIAPAGVVQPTVTSLRLQFVCSHTFQQLPWMFTGKRIEKSSQSKRQAQLYSSTSHDSSLVLRCPLTAHAIRVRSTCPNRAGAEASVGPTQEHQVQTCRRAFGVYTKMPIALKICLQRALQCCKCPSVTQGGVDNVGDRK